MEGYLTENIDYSLEPKIGRAWRNLFAEMRFGLVAGSRSWPPAAGIAAATGVAKCEGARSGRMNSRQNYVGLPSKKHWKCLSRRLIGHRHGGERSAAGEELIRAWLTYQIDRNINYTNFCTEYCSFCAFYRPLGAKDGYILSFEEIYKKIEEMMELGGTGVLLQGGLHPDLQIEYYENLLRSLKSAFRNMHLHCFSAPEINCIAEVSGLSGERDDRGG